MLDCNISLKADFIKTKNSAKKKSNSIYHIIQTKLTMNKTQ